MSDISKFQLLYYDNGSKCNPKNLDNNTKVDLELGTGTH
jgi:hypothetical protein